MTLKVYTSPIIPTAQIPHGFFTKAGGVSDGIYESLNCGPGSDDNPADVIENRTRVVKHLAGTDAPLATLYQIHSANVVVADGPHPLDSLPKADGIVCKTKGLVIGVLTADCTPVLFADAKAGVIAAAHAGWRGALAGILENTVKEMERQGASRQNITAAIGPCIGQDSYEVGQDFYDPFLKADPAFQAFFKAGKEAKHLFDLEGFVAAKLDALGLENTSRTGLDTYQNEAEFFSFRRTTHREQADYGRQISAIYLPG